LFSAAQAFILPQTRTHGKGDQGSIYDHNFLRFLPIFCEEIGVFLKNQCYDQNFLQKLAVVRAKNANIFAKFFGENI
jgi:hypothetical protein